MSPIQCLKKSFWDHVATVNHEKLILGKRQLLAIESMLIDRLDAAIETGRVTVDHAGLVQVLEALFPGHYGATLKPPQPTNSPPGTDERLEVYATRHARGERLYHPDDGCPIRNDRLALKGRLRMNGGNRFDEHNGLSAEFLGWHETCEEEAFDDDA